MQRRADAQPLPELVEQPRPAEAPRVQHLDLAGVRGRDRLLRVEEPRDRGDQPGQRVAVHGLGAAEVVDHLRRGHPGDRVAFAVRQLQIRHRRPVAVAPLRLPQVHPYTVSTYPLVKSSDTPEVVCLHEFACSGDSASLLPAQSLRATPKYAYELRKSGQNPRLLARNQANTDQTTEFGYDPGLIEA